MPETERKLPLRLWARRAHEYHPGYSVPKDIILTSETDAKSLYNMSSPTLVGEYVLVKATRGRRVQVVHEDDVPVT